MGEFKPRPYQDPDHIAAMWGLWFLLKWVAIFTALHFAPWWWTEPVGVILACAQISSLGVTGGFTFSGRIRERAETFNARRESGNAIRWMNHAANNHHKD